MEKKIIYCNDGNDIKTIPYSEYLELIKLYKETYTLLNTYEYKNHYYKLSFRGMTDKSAYFCGYVQNVPDDTKYVPHGEFTGGYEDYSGFDCAHAYDFFSLSYTHSSPKCTFKTAEFAHKECQKIIDNVFNVNENENINVNA